MATHKNDTGEITGALLRPIERVTVNQQVVARLKSFLQSENVRVGSKLPSERRLASMLNVGRPSIREVLRSLNILGIVKSKQGDGTYLISSIHRLLSDPDHILTFQESLDLAELAEARFIIEPTIASLAAKRASREELSQIEAHLRGMHGSLNDRTKFLEHDLQFHLSIVKACGNDVLKRMMSVVLKGLFDHGAQLVKNYSDLGAIYRLHTDIFRAIENHDSRRAHSAMVCHMRVSKKENVRPARRTRQTMA
ncbi:MAG TPA: FadR/GntR family transcriptional regulator [Terriglobia bacterium]|jgi:GntR family transcriptional repressor for pyruvate dehydrogenase complex|nr:FadR/GntR family transcriptional regulator [Terriglobia bacterium]